MRRILIAVIGFTAAAFVVLGGSSVRWWSYDTGDMRSAIGLRGVEMCLSENCTYTSLERLEDDVDWIRAGVASYTAALLTAGIVLVIAGMVAAGRRLLVLANTGLVASLSAVITGIWFISTAPEYTGMQFDYSVYLYFSGAGLGILVSLAGLQKPKTTAISDGDARRITGQDMNSRHSQ